MQRYDGHGACFLTAEKHPAVIAATAKIECSVRMFPPASSTTFDLIGCMATERWNKKQIAGPNGNRHTGQAVEAEGEDDWKWETDGSNR